MSRPDAMDLDVAALLGLDAERFAAASARPRAAAPRRSWSRQSSPRKTSPRQSSAWSSSPWLWVIVPLTAALVVGFGMSLRSEKAEPAPEQTAVRAVEPEVDAGDAPRAMSLKIIDGPRRASPRPVPRPRNIPMSELGPLPAGAPSSHVAELAPVAQAPSVAPAPEAATAEPAPVEPTALFADRELAPPPPAEPPEAASQP